MACSTYIANTLNAYFSLGCLQNLLMEGNDCHNFMIFFVIISYALQGPTLSGEGYTNVTGFSYNITSLKFL